MLILGFQRMLCECYASRYQYTVELDQGCNSQPSFGRGVVVGCPFTMNAILAPVGFLGNRFNSEVEITSGLICYCLPVFPQLYRQRIKKLFSPSRPSHAYLHNSVLPKHNPYKRHFDSPQGVQELKPSQSGRLSVSKAQSIDLVSQESPKIWNQNYPGNIGLKRSSLKRHRTSSLWAVLIRRAKIARISELTLDKIHSEGKLGS